MSNRTLLVTGANGFVGSALIRALQQAPDIMVRGAYRQAPSSAVNQFSIGDIGPDTDWSKALEDVDVIVHCAARVHVMRDAGSMESIASFRKVNVEGTANLARQAVAAGVKRLVFVSSIKVNGETTTGLPPFSHDSPPAPQDAYGTSKWEAEQKLWDIARETGLEVVIVRPPLVYGPGVKANFLRLMQVVRMGIPLPFGSVQNQRSMVYIGNLIDLLVLCITHTRAAAQTFMVSDGVDLSTAELIRQLAVCMHRRPNLINLSPGLLKFIFRLLGKSALSDRVLGSLQVNISYTQDRLEWHAPYTTAQGIAATVNS